jgi:excisionase family DNA binding protein
MAEFNEPLWTVKDAASYLRLPISAIYKMTAPKGRLRIPHVRLAGRLRFRRRDLDDWLDCLTVSHLEVLRKARNSARQVSNGFDSQETTVER